VSIERQGSEIARMLVTASVVGHDVKAFESSSQAAEGSGPVETPWMQINVASDCPLVARHRQTLDGRARCEMEAVDHRVEHMMKTTGLFSARFNRLARWRPRLEGEYYRRPSSSLSHKGLLDQMRGWSMTCTTASWLTLTRMQSWREFFADYQRSTIPAVGRHQ